MIDTNSAEKKKNKLRLDQLMLLNNLVESRNEAQGLILAGKVMVNEKIVTKAGTLFHNDAKIHIIDDKCLYVSRGGLKLEHALNEFSIDVKDSICLDVGASTGGFTHCLLLRGAKKVYAVDVGYGQLHWKLRNHPQVINMEKVNIRYVKKEDFSEDFNVITMDTSFISLKLVIPAVLALVNANTIIIALIKPQFEAGKEKIKKGGIVKDLFIHDEVIEDMKKFVYNNTILNIIGIIPSPILGAKGNKEFLMVLNGR
jgi:23S rRNA (cytidine1920-2'-O)/16S rRNA (cytidine1409-2'-O)-methyltransferase